MIVRLSGVILEKTPARVVLDVQGVGYEVLIGVMAYDRLPSPGDSCTVLVYHQFREDGQTLFGFRLQEEKEMFEHLITISGIGPKMAMTILNGIVLNELAAAISNNDSRRLQAVPGIGKKTAERIVVELRDKVDPFAGLNANSDNGMPGGVLRDVALALTSLGFSQEQAKRMAQAALEANPGVSDTEGLLKAALARK